MRRPLAALPLLALCAVPLAAQSATLASLSAHAGPPVRRLTVDAAHSTVGFTVRFMGLSDVRGAFADFSGTVMVDTTDATRSSVSLVIRTASINTNSAMRDRDLRSPNFFDAERYPRIAFHSTAITRSPTGFVARGPLTMHGVTREVAIPFTQLHPLQRDAWENMRIGFQGALRLNRHDFGVEGTKFWNSEYDPGRMSVGDSVDIDLIVSATASNVERWTAPRADSLLVTMGTDGIVPALAHFRAAAADTATALGHAREGVLSNAAAKLMQRGRYGDAAQVYQALADWNPDATVFAALGEAQLMAGRLADAERAFQRALVADSSNTVAGEYLRRLVPRG